MSISCIVDNAASYLGYTILKPVQKEVVTLFLKGNDVFAILPTGYGKSLCLMCLPFALDMLLEKQPGYSLVIVLSPLKALMESQVCFFFFVYMLMYMIVIYA